MDWVAIRTEVIPRDIRAITVHVRHRFALETLDGELREGRLTYYTPFGPMQWCVAPMLDPAEEGKCAGVWTLNHVQNPGDPQHGRKVPDEPGYLVSLCAWHHQGQEAGHIWATASENIVLQWEYLKEHST